MNHYELNAFHFHSYNESIHHTLSNIYLPLEQDQDEILYQYYNPL